MSRPTHQSVLIAALVLIVLADASIAPAQPRIPRIPVPTTMVLALPAPGETFGNKPVIAIGVGTKVYKFVVLDAYTLDSRGGWQWIDIWQLVNQYPVMMQAQGQNMDKFAKIAPGETYTVNGMFSPVNRVFEVMSSEAGRGPFAPSEKY
ncbi:MAG: hypothetical protein ACREQB_03000 [Candidatus Binataceae bacterium]